MAMASVSNSTEEFTLWLKNKLVDLNTDDEVFSPYILGILETDDNEEEKSEALVSVLSEIIENDTDDICSEILKKWSEMLEKVLREEEKNAVKVNVDEKLAKLMLESKLQPLQVVSTTSVEQRKLKEAILAQYAQVSDGELSEEDEDETAARTCSPAVMKNTNAEFVAKAEREKRQKEKEESQRKREKDKEDRAKQKAKDEERKEKEKKRTQKGEKRR